MTKYNPDDVSIYSKSVKSGSTCEDDLPLTPPRSLASSQTAPSSDASHETSICTPLVTLAEEILSNARTLSDFYTSRSLPQPSFDLDGPEDYHNDLPDDIVGVRSKLREATADMQALAAGPKENIMWMAWSYHDVSLLHYVSQFKIADAVPLHGTVTIEEVSMARPCNTIDPVVDCTLRLRPSPTLLMAV